MVTFLFTLLASALTFALTEGLNKGSEKLALQDETEVMGFEGEQMKDTAADDLALEEGRADDIDQQADDLQAVFDTQSANLDAVGRQDEEMFRNELNNIIAVQKVGTAGSGFSSKSSTTTVLANESTRKTEKDIATNWSNIQGQKDTLQNQLTVDQNYLRGTAETIRTDAKNTFDTNTEKGDYLITEASDMITDWNDSGWNTFFGGGRAKRS